MARKIRQKVEPVSTAAPATGPSDGRKMIAVAAYCRAQARGFEPGREPADWLEAEQEVAVCAHAQGSDH